MPGLGFDGRPSPADLHEAVRTLDTLRETAAYFGVAISTICDWRKRPEYREYLAALAKAAKDKIAGEVEADRKLAMDTARRVAEHSDPHAALNGARLLLDVHDKIEAAAAAPADEATTGDRSGLAGKVASLLELVRPKPPAG